MMCLILDVCAEWLKIDILPPLEGILVKYPDLGQLYFRFFLGM